MPIQVLFYNFTKNKYRTRIRGRKFYNHTTNLMIKKFFKKSFLPILVALTSFSATSQDLTPEIIFPDPHNGAVLYGLSDNGDWGISCVAAGSEGFSDFAGAILYNLRTTPCESVDLAPNESFAAGFDVTDDGKTVVGSYQQQPAVCRLENGKWTWYKLPVPDRTFQVRNVFTDEMATYRLNAGEVYSVTPDGKYAVGMADCAEYINIEVGVMWDLETMEMITLPGLGLENSNFNRLTQISSDGRYVVGRRGGYFIYDRNTRTSRNARVGLDIYAQGMSTDAKYMSGVTTRGEVPYASYWNLETNELTVIEDDLYADAVAWTITNDGVPLIARPYLTPYADAYVFHDGFLFSFYDLLTQAYGINPDSYGIDNTGKPFKVSADGRTIVLLTATNNCYVLRLKEDITAALDRIDLFRTWNAMPANGTQMTALGDVTITFAYPVKLTGSKENAVSLLNAKGETIATPVDFSVEGSTLKIKFDPMTLNPDEKYTVRLAEGTIGIQGREKSANPEINIEYTGRENKAVKRVKIYPEAGSSLPTLSLNDNPVMITFDSNVKVNVPEGGNRPIAKVYIEGETDLYATTEMDVDLTSGNILVLFPASTVPLYRGSDYRIEVPAGAVTDMSGYGASEAFTITYKGSYVPQLGDEKYLFRSTCDDYTNFLFYEGDHGTPVSEYAEMGFTADNTPWSVVREDNFSEDMAFGSHSVYTDGRKADDWVATRQILIPADGKSYLAFDSQSYRKNKKDNLKVYVYENNSILNMLSSATVEDIRKNGELVYNELQDPGASEDKLAGEWRHNTVDLSKYAGKSIYICFVNDNQNQSMVMIDNIEVVRDVKAFLTLRNKTNVVSQRATSIYGMLSVSSELASFSDLEMTLRDASGKEISTISEKGLNLKAGDYYNFEFPKLLPLTRGEENPFTIEYKLDDDQLSYEGVVRNLMFEPVKRVVIEEFTGRDCQFCPGGIATMDHLESLYGDRVIPVALHCYNGSDPKGAYVMQYWQFLEIGAAPMARINRGPAASPILQTPSGYVNTTAGITEATEKLWKDYVTEELSEPAYMEVYLEDNGADKYNFKYTAKVTSALNLEDQNVRLFGVVLEDGLLDYQVNAYYATKEPILGEWGEGGTYGIPRTYYLFDNVARTTWGVSYNGSAGLVPSTIEAGKEYKVQLTVPISDIVQKPENCKFVVMLIDGNTGKVINATRSGIVSGVESVTSGNLGDVKAYTVNGGVLIESESHADVRVYNISGQEIARGSGEGTFSIDTKGYSGVVIVNITTENGHKVAKLLAR